MDRGFRWFELLSTPSFQANGRAQIHTVLAELGAISAGCRRLTATAGLSWLATEFVGSMS